MTSMVPIEYLLRFIEEDSPFGDVTSDAVIPQRPCRAVIRAEQEGVIAGIAEACALFMHFGIRAEPNKTGRGYRYNGRYCSLPRRQCKRYPPR